MDAIKDLAIPLLALLIIVAENMALPIHKIIGRMLEIIYKKNDSINALATTIGPAIRSSLYSLHRDRLVGWEAFELHLRLFAISSHVDLESRLVRFSRRSLTRWLLAIRTRLKLNSIMGAVGCIIPVLLLVFMPSASNQESQTNGSTIVILVAYLSWAALFALVTLSVYLNFRVASIEPYNQYPNSLHDCLRYVYRSFRSWSRLVPWLVLVTIVIVILILVSLFTSFDPDSTVYRFRWRNIFGIIRAMFFAYAVWVLVFHLIPNPSGKTVKKASYYLSYQFHFPDYRQVSHWILFIAAIFIASVTYVIDGSLLIYDHLNLIAGFCVTILCLISFSILKLAIGGKAATMSMAEYDKEYKYFLQDFFFILKTILLLVLIIISSITFLAMVMDIVQSTVLQFVSMITFVVVLYMQVLLLIEIYFSREIRNLFNEEYIESESNELRERARILLWW